MSLLNEPTLPERQRAQEANHIRSIDVQVLDALLRIEELLSNLNECLTAPRGAKVEGDIDDVITNISPRETPFMAGGLINFDTAPGGVTVVDTKPVAVKRKPLPKTL